MRNYLTALASGWRAGKKQARKRLTELQRDDAARRLLLEVGKWDGVSPVSSTPGAITHAESVAELNEIRAILHPPADDKPMTATEVLELKRNYPDTQPAVMPIRGPQDAAS